MKAVVLEIRNGKAAVLRKDGIVQKIQQGGLSVGDTIELQKEDSGGKILSIAGLRRYGALAAAILLFLSLGLVYSYYTAFACAYVSVDVNPSLEFSLNRLDRVLSVDAVNADAQPLVDALEARKIQNATLPDALENVWALLAEDQYLAPDKDAYLLLNISTDDSAQSGRLLAAAEQALSELDAESADGSTGTSETGATHVHLLTASSTKERKQARALGISAGEYKEIQGLKARERHAENAENAGTADAAESLPAGENAEISLDAEDVSRYAGYSLQDYFEASGQIPGRETGRMKGAGVFPGNGMDQNGSMEAPEAGEGHREAGKAQADAPSPEKPGDTEKPSQPAGTPSEETGLSDDRPSGRNGSDRDGEAADREKDTDKDKDQDRGIGRDADADREKDVNKEKNTNSDRNSGDSTSLDPAEQEKPAEGRNAERQAGEGRQGLANDPGRDAAPGNAEDAAGTPNSENAGGKAGNGVSPAAPRDGKSAGDAGRDAENKQPPIPENRGEENGGRTEEMPENPQRDAGAKDPDGAAAESAPSPRGDAGNNSIGSTATTQEDGGSQSQETGVRQTEEGTAASENEKAGDTGNLPATHEENPALGNPPEQQEGGKPADGRDILPADGEEKAPVDLTGPATEIGLRDTDPKGRAATDPLPPQNLETAGDGSIESASASAPSETSENAGATENAGADGSASSQKGGESMANTAENGDPGTSGSESANVSGASGSGRPDRGGAEPPSGEGHSGQTGSQPGGRRGGEGNPSGNRGTSSGNGARK